MAWPAPWYKECPKYRSFDISFSEIYRWYQFTLMSVLLMALCMHVIFSVNFTKMWLVQTHKIQGSVQFIRRYITVTQRRPICELFSVNLYVFYTAPSYIYVNIFSFIIKGCHWQSPLCWARTRAISTGIQGFSLMYVWMMRMISYPTAWCTWQKAHEHDLHHPLHGNIHRSP